AISLNAKHSKRKRTSFGMGCLRLQACNFEVGLKFPRANTGGKYFRFLIEQQSTRILPGKGAAFPPPYGQPKTSLQFYVCPRHPSSLQTEHPIEFFAVLPRARPDFAVPPAVRSCRFPLFRSTRTQNT